MQMVANVASGGAVVNALARQVGAAVEVVDVGVAAPLLFPEGVVQRRIRSGTRDFSREPALTRDEAVAATAWAPAIGCSSPET